MKSIWKNLGEIQIVGTLISISVLLFLLFKTDEPIPSITLGVALEVLTQLFDLQKRHHDSEERILKANALSQALYRDDWLLGQIQNISEDYLTVKDVWFESFRLRAKNVIEDTRAVLHEMAQARLTVENDSIWRFGLSGFKMASKSIKGVAFVNEAYWKGPDAERDLQDLVNVMQLGVTVTHIFAYPANTMSDLHNILEKQQDLGIDVRIADKDDINRMLAEDFVVVDDRAAARPGARPGKAEIITIDGVEIGGLLRKFDALLSRSTQFTRSEKVA